MRISPSQFAWGIILYTYDPVGICIYCGNDEGALTDEHIIPLGLAGGHVLPRSSCKACAKATGKFEGVVLRTVLGDLRMRNKFPTRRPHERPTLRTINTAKGTKLIPTSDYPAPYVVYQFEKAGILLGAPPGLTISHKVPVIIGDPTYAEFKTTHAWDGVLKFRFQPDEFRRLLLKIGYGYAVAHLGYGSFRPLSVPYFMHAGRNLSYLVGQNSDKEPMDDKWLHKTRANVSMTQDGKWLVIAEIRLFAGADTPTYHAVVGDFESPSQLRPVLEKLRDRGDIEVAVWRP